MTEDVFTSADGDELTRKQIVYRGWHKGSVEETEDGFVVDGVEYTPVTDDSSGERDP